MSNYSFSCFVNVSTTSITDHGWIVAHPQDLSFDTSGNGYAISAIVIIFFLLGVPWNLLVIGAIIKKKLYTQPIIMLMLNLALTNLLVALLVMPFNIVSGIRGEYTFGESDQIRCRVCQTGMVIILLPWVSVHTLSLMAVDRFIYLKQPLKYVTIVTPLRTFVALGIVWIVCFLLSLPPLFGFGEIRFAYTVANCVPFLVGRTHISPNYYYIMLLTVEAFIPIVTLFVLYVWVLYIIKSTLAKSIKRSLSINSKSTKKEDKVNRTLRSASNRKNQLRLAGLFGAIFTANIITWIPMVGLAITAAILGPMQIPTVAYTIPYLSFLSETVIHPMLEVCLIRDIKVMISKCFVELKIKLLASDCCCGRHLSEVGTAKAKSTFSDSEAKEVTSSPIVSESPIEIV